MIHVFRLLAAHQLANVSFCKGCGWKLEVGPMKCGWWEVGLKIVGRSDFDM